MFKQNIKRCFPSPLRKKKRTLFNPPHHLPSRGGLEGKCPLRGTWVVPGPSISLLKKELVRQLVYGHLPKILHDISCHFKIFSRKLLIYIVIF